MLNKGGVKARTCDEVHITKNGVIFWQFIVLDTLFLCVVLPSGIVGFHSKN